MPDVSLEHRWDVIAFTTAIRFVTNPEEPSQELMPPNPSLHPPDTSDGFGWLLGDQKTTVFLVCYFTALLGPTFDSFKLASLASSQVSPGGAPASSLPACMHLILQGQRSPASSMEALLTTPAHSGLLIRSPEMPEVTMWFTQ